MGYADYTIYRMQQSMLRGPVKHGRKGDCCESSTKQSEMEEAPFIGALHCDLHGTGDFGGEHPRGRTRNDGGNLGCAPGGEYE